MSPDRRVYLLDARHLSPETIAVTFAKTSRSPESFQDIAQELTDSKSAEFHEKWVVGYGHSSIAEHAVLHIALENISRLAIEPIEGNRLASYTEKSSRYQKWGRDFFHTPQELENHPLRTEYIQTCSRLLDFYQKSLEVTRNIVAAENPKKDGESDTAWEQRIRSKFADSCRYILPASALANVGVTINARSLEHALCKMLSHPLAEVRAIGTEIQKVAQETVPTLVKYVCSKTFLQEIQNNFSNIAQSIPKTTGEFEDWCNLIQYDPQNDQNVLASALYRYGALSFQDALSYVKSCSTQQLEKLADILFSDLGKYDSPIREVEHSTYKFDLILDQGAYFELKRHRMMTQTVQELSTNLGYAVPSLISRANLEEEYHAVMQAAHQTYQRLAEISPYLAAYIVPNAYNRRVLLTMNYRSAHHLIALRTAPNAHFAIRRVAHRMAEEISKVSPIIGNRLRISTSETWQAVETEYFTQTRCMVNP